MKIIEPSVELIEKPEQAKLIRYIETAARVCYKSEDKMTEGSGERIVRDLIKRGHEAAIEHGAVSVRIICDRGVSHEIVRHRLASYCQESTRYCNYTKEKHGGEVTFILPPWVQNPPQTGTDKVWHLAMSDAEDDYQYLISQGWTPEQARSILPNSLKTEIVMTANMREWRHFLRLRTSKNAHPQMRQVAKMILDLLKTNYPVFFEDFQEEGDE